MDVVCDNDDQLDENARPWRGIVRKFDEEKSAYEVYALDDDEKVQSVLHTFVHRAHDLHPDDDVVVIDAEGSKERLGKLVRMSGKRCQIDFGDSFEVTDLSFVWPAPYEVGSYVSVESSSNNDESIFGRICASWMRGYVYNVRTQSGKTISNIPRGMIHLLRPIRVHERVEARWGIIFGGKEWLPGRITRISFRKIWGCKIALYDIEYDNGEIETGVDRSLIRLKEGG